MANQPSNSDERRKPTTKRLPLDEIELHPEGIEYPNDAHRRPIEAIGEGEFRQNPKVTPESHFTDANWTIISGERRVQDAVEHHDWDELLVEVVGPFDTEQEERRALLDYNDYRNLTPGEKILYAERWENYYASLPDFDDTPAVRAAEHAGISKTTYYDGKRIKKAAEDGEWGFQSPEWMSPEERKVASKQWRLLIEGKATIGGAYEKVEITDDTTQGLQSDHEYPELLYDEDLLDNEELIDDDKRVDEPLLASFIISLNKFNRLLRKVSPYSTIKETSYDSVADIYLEFHRDEVRAVTAETSDWQSTHVVSEEWFKGVPTEPEHPIGICIGSERLRQISSLMDGDIRIELRGPEGSTQASHFVIRDGNAYYCQVNLLDEDTPLNDVIP